MYFKNVPKSKKFVIIVAIENAKLKLLKVLSSYNNAICDSSKLFTTINQGDKEPRIFSAKCDVILRFRRISFNMPQGFIIRFRFRNRDSVFALLEFYCNVHRNLFPFFFFFFFFFLLSMDHLLRT